MPTDNSGKILCIFISEFDNHFGRRIAYAYPEHFFDSFTKDQLSRVTFLTITQNQLTNRIISFEVFDYRIIGCSQCIRSERYERYHSRFNVSFVLNKNISHSQQYAYEVLVRKLNHYFVSHEISSQFISNADRGCHSTTTTTTTTTKSQTNNKTNATISNEDVENNDLNRLLNETTITAAAFGRHSELQSTSCHYGARPLKDVLFDIFEQLNNYDQCEVPVDDTGSIHLKITRFPNYFNPIDDEDVPLLLQKLSDVSNCDLTIQQLAPFIDGRNHVAKIARLAQVEIRLVKSCLQNLRHFGVVTMVPIFLYSASYMAFPKLRDFMNDSNMQNECFAFAFLLDDSPEKLSHTVKFNAIRDIMRFYSLLRPGAILKDIVAHFHETCKIVDVCRVIRYGELNQLIQRIHTYPILQASTTTTAAATSATTSTTTPSSTITPGGLSSVLDSSVEMDQALRQRLFESSSARKMLDGLHSTDKISCSLGGVRLSELNTVLKSEASVDIINY